MDGLTLAQVAGRLSCSYRTVRRLVERYKLSNGEDGLAATDVRTGKKPHYVVTEEQFQSFLMQRSTLNKKRLAARG